MECVVCGKELNTSRNGGRGRKRKYCDEHSLEDLDKRLDYKRFWQVREKFREDIKRRRIEEGFTGIRDPLLYSGYVDKNKVEWGTFSLGSQRSVPYKLNDSQINVSRELINLNQEVEKLRNYDRSR